MTAEELDRLESTVIDTGCTPEEIMADHQLLRRAEESVTNG